MFKDWNGFIVPERDDEKVLNRRVAQCAEAVQAVKALNIKHDVMVQAGGNWGYWPRQFSALFNAVYTFEPDATCFACLTSNTDSLPNVVRLQAALGFERELVDLWRDVDTTGNQKINGPGIYPTLRIDDLNLPICDLIYLDIEGGEMDGLLGATGTIDRCQPIVIYEHRKSFDPKQKVQHYMHSLHYEHIDTIGNDVVMRPC